MKFVFACFIMLCGNIVAAQHQIYGKVLLKGSNEGIAGCSVYLNNTSKGTITDSKGIFVITNVPERGFELIVSFVGFETSVEKYNGYRDSDSLIIELNPKGKTLESVNVIANSRETWEKWGNIFSKYLLGTNDVSRCEITNKEEVTFKYDKQLDILYAKSKVPLKILNNKLGYEIQYDLKSCSINFNNSFVLFEGNIFFKEFNDNKRSYWQKRRKNVYMGSLRHFFRAINNEQMTTQGFQLVKLGEEINIDDILNGENERYLGFKNSNCIKKNVLSNNNIQIEPEGYVAVKYKKGLEDVGFLKFAGMERSRREPISIFYIRGKARLEVDKEGNYMPANDIVTFGYWNWAGRIGNLLPLDYEPEIVASEIVEMQLKNRMLDTVAVIKKIQALKPIYVVGKKSDRKKLEALNNKYTTGTFSINTADSYTVDVINDSMAETHGDVYNYITSKIPGLVTQYKGISKVLCEQNSYSKIKTTSNAGTAFQMEIPEPVPIDLVYLNESETDRMILERLSIKEIALIKFFRRFPLKPGLPAALCIYTKK